MLAGWSSFAVKGFWPYVIIFINVCDVITRAGFTVVGDPEQSKYGDPDQ
jgi:hypothetical protein